MSKPLPNCSCLEPGKGGMGKCPRHGPDKSEWRAKESKPQRGLARTKRLTQGQRDEVTKAFERGIVTMKLREMGKAAPLGIEYGYRCETCGSRLGQTLEEAMKAVGRGSHETARAAHPAGHGYSPKHWPNLGYSDPDNILIECGHCNQAREPDPQWTKEDAGR